MLGTQPQRCRGHLVVSNYIPFSSPIQERVGEHLWNAHRHSPRGTSFPDLKRRGTEPSHSGPREPVWQEPCVLQAGAFGLRWSQLLYAYQMEKVASASPLGCPEDVTKGLSNKPRGGTEAHSISHRIHEASQAQMHATGMQMPFEIRNHLKHRVLCTPRCHRFSLPISLLRTELETHFHRRSSLPTHAHVCLVSSRV